MHAPDDGVYGPPVGFIPDETECVHHPCVGASQKDHGPICGIEEHRLVVLDGIGLPALLVDEEGSARVFEIVSSGNVTCDENPWRDLGDSIGPGEGGRVSSQLGFGKARRHSDLVDPPVLLARVPSL